MTLEGEQRHKQTDRHTDGQTNGIDQRKVITKPHANCNIIECLFKMLFNINTHNSKKDQKNTSFIARCHDEKKVFKSELMESYWKEIRFCDFKENVSRYKCTCTQK